MSSRTLEYTLLRTKEQIALRTTPHNTGLLHTHTHTHTHTCKAHLVICSLCIYEDVCIYVHIETDRQTEARLMSVPSKPKGILEYFLGYSPPLYTFSLSRSLSLCVCVCVCVCVYIPIYTYMYIYIHTSFPWEGKPKRYWAPLYSV
jgi:hypothetical protein